MALRHFRPARIEKKDEVMSTKSKLLGLIGDTQLDSFSESILIDVLAAKIKSLESEINDAGVRAAKAEQRMSDMYEREKRDYDNFRRGDYRKYMSGYYYFIGANENKIGIEITCGKLRVFERRKKVNYVCPQINSEQFHNGWERK